MFTYFKIRNIKHLIRKMPFFCTSERWKNNVIEGRNQMWQTYCRYSRYDIFNLFVTHSLNNKNVSNLKFQSIYFIFSHLTLCHQQYFTYKVCEGNSCRDKWGSEPTFFLFQLYFLFLSHELYLDDVHVWQIKWRLSCEVSAINSIKLVIKKM